MLYLVATPIGNLKDITLRALEVLKECDYILCEDTRRTAILLNHYEIAKPLKTYHKFNEASKEEPILKDLLNGMTVALVSDAGTPGISDPGARLVYACHAEKVKVCSIPGPCAAITALASSGLPTDRFLFYGFLPKKSGELNTTLNEILSLPFTIICYESPHRLKDVLDAIHLIDPLRKLVVARELTKKFEEIVQGLPEELIQHWQQLEIKGEIVLLIQPSSSEPNPEIWDPISLEDHVKLIQTTYFLSQMDAMKIVGYLRKLSKREIYKILHR